MHQAKIDNPSSDDTPEHLEIETRLRIGELVRGTWKILRLLGKGSFTEVYHARNQEIGKFVALKTIDIIHQRDENIRKAFLQEIYTWLRIDEHPFIIPLKRIEEFDHLFLIETELVAPDESGCITIGDHLRRDEEPIDLEKALEWSIQICLGMEHAYSEGIICHGDLTSDNMLITQDGYVKISDLGMVKGLGILFVL